MVRPIMQTFVVFMFNVNTAFMICAAMYVYAKMTQDEKNQQHRIDHSMRMTSVRQK